MPVLVEAIANPSPQDLTDLAKIYADAPDWLLTPYADARQLIEAGLTEGRLIAGRFNDRLLGAALLDRQGDVWRLSHLCVRKVTRRRGVGQRLIDQARQLASEAGRPLHLSAPANHLEPQALAARLKLPLDSL